uniref:Uncharacterized protein n=1 Tax=Heterorhabditis bacteriophora TaxID=37862 RepID=A0A1I7X689_HETBA
MPPPLKITKLRTSMSEERISEILKQAVISTSFKYSWLIFAIFSMDLSYNFINLLQISCFVRKIILNIELLDITT